MKAAVGLDLGGTKIAGGLLDADGRIHQRRLRATPHGGAASIVQVLATLAAELIEAGGRMGFELSGLGVATGGSVDAERGVVTHATQMLPDWQGLALGPILQARVGVPTRVENDVNALAVAELALGSARDLEDALFVAVGTGIGGAIARRGSLERGAHGMGGEVGHVTASLDGGRPCQCGGRDHIESYASGPAIERDYAARAGLSRPLPLVEVASRARSGDERARAAIEEAGAILGACLGGIANLLDPECVIVGGGVVELGPRFLDPLQRALDEQAFVPLAPIRASHFGPDAALVGAAWLALSA